MNRDISIAKSFQTQSGEDLNSASRLSAYDLQTQLRAGQQQRAITRNRPTGEGFGDSTMRLGPGATIAIAISDGKGRSREVVIPMNLIGNAAIASVSGGGVVDVEARVAINALLAMFRSLAVIDS